MKKIAFNDQFFSRLFKALGDRTRLRILQVLSRGEMSVREITKAMNIPQPTVSRHLAILRQNDFVNSRRSANQVYYSLNKVTVDSCCSGFCDCLESPVYVVVKKKK